MSDTETLLLNGSKLHHNQMPYFMTKPTTLREYLTVLKPAKVKLHLGCGGVRWRDFINVDLHPHESDVQDSSRNGCVADVFDDMQSLGLPDNSVDEIFTSHTIDHFTRWAAIDMLKDWHRMLNPNGRLIIEVADFTRCVLWLFHPSREKRCLAKTQFYGNQWDKIDFETHRYVWSAGELRTTLYEIGFKSVQLDHKTWTHHPGRDMHVESVK